MGRAIFTAIQRAMPRVLALLRKGQWRGLASRLRRRLRHVEVPRSRKALAQVITALGHQDWVVLLEGSFGGGATQASQRSALAWRAQGRYVLVLRAPVVGDGCLVSVYEPINTQMPTMAERHPEARTAYWRGWLRAWPDWGCFMPQSRPTLECHSLVGFGDVLGLQRWLAHAQERGFATTFFWHDHYALCPSPHLMNQWGQYCDLPDTETCARCLRANPHSVAPKNTVQRIEAWRSAWHDVLAGATRCIVFSNDSAALIARALAPELIATDAQDVAAASAARRIADNTAAPIPIKITPHDMGYFPPKQIALPSGPLVIGIFGHIAAHKGAEVVHALAQAICVGQSAARIALFGSIDTPLPKGIGRVYGPYTPSDLPRLVEAAGVNVVLFPSIWPETFSYVCHEAMRMGLPLVCFDVGAQAEAVRTYPRGTVLPLCSGVDVLAEIEAFINQHDEWFSAS